MSLELGIIGVIVGALLSLIGNAVAQWVTMQKEKAQWERQQEATQRNQKREDDKEARKAIIDIYHNCISRLALVVASNYQTLDLSSEQKLELYKETLHWLALLALHRSDLYFDSRRPFQQSIDDFAMSPEAHAKLLLADVNKMAVYDRVLSPNSPPQEKTDHNKRRAQVDVEEDFRRRKAIEGIELRKSYMVECDISTLAPSQREKLWDMYYKQNQGIPQTIYLSVPAYDEKTKQVQLKGPGIWNAALDPTCASPLEIFAAWEDAYERALEAAEEAKAAHTERESA